MATASLGRLTLDLVARIAGYTEPLNKAERETRKSTKAISESFDLASLAVKGLGVVMGGLSVAGVIAYSEKVINAGNDIQKFAKLANTSVGQLQYYAKGAETAGISLESFSDKMKDMQDRIGDFQQTGGGPLADFFTNIAPRVGVTIQQFQKLSGPEALQLFYNSLEKAGASTNDMKFYMEQIISDSSLMIPLLEKNGQGFKFWGDAAQKAGAIMSDDMVKSLTDAKTNLQLMDLQWQGLQATLVNKVVPVVELIVENWDKVEAGAIALSAVIGTRLALSFGLAGAQAAASLITYARYQIRLAQMAGETITLATVTRGLGGAMLSLVGGPLGLIALGVQVAIAGGTYYAMTRKTEDATDAFDMQGKSIADLINHYNGLSEAKKRAFTYDAVKALQDDTEAYKKAKEAFYDSAVGIAYESANSESSIKAVDALVAKFKDGKISALDFADGMSKLGIYTDKQIATAVKFAEQSDSSKTAMDNQKKAVDALSGVTDKNTKAQEKFNTVLQDQARLLGVMPDKWNAYTQKQREALTNILTDKQRQDYIQANMAAGWSREQAEYTADYRNSAGLGYVGQRLDDDQLKIVTAGFNQKNYTFNKQDLAAIAKVQGIAKANNFAQIEGLYGLPAGTLAALVLKESSGNINAISPTGAKGLFQTTGVFRKEYKLNANSSVEAQATAAATDLSKNIKYFGGDLSKALMAYNAGRAGAETYLNGGLSSSKRKEVAGYVPGFQKWFAGVNGKSAIDNSILMPSQSDLLQQYANSAQAAYDLSERRKEVDSQYYSESEKLAKEHQDRIDKITETYTGTKELKIRLAQENALYQEQIVQLDVSKQQELNQLKEFETDRITQIRQSYDEEIRLMTVSTKYFGKERDERIALLERAKQAEIDAVEREENEQVQSAFEAYLNETEIVVKRYQREREEIQKTYQLTQETRAKLLQANQMGIFGAINQASDNVLQYGQNASQELYQKNDQNGFAQWSLQNQYSSDMAGLNSAFSNHISSVDLIADENDRNAQLLAAREQFLQAKALLDDEYAQRERDLYTLQVTSALDTAQQTASGMSEVLGDMLGEQNAMYKASYVMAKGFAISKAIMNAPETFSNVYTSVSAIPLIGPYIAPAMAAAAVAVQVAQASKIKGMSLQGMAHDGIDNIPREGTWLLNKGERVLNPKQNKDLTSYLDKRNSSTGNITINNNVGAQVNANQNSDGSVTIDIVDQRIAQSWQNMRRGNSNESQAIQGAFGLTPTRG